MPGPAPPEGTVAVPRAVAAAARVLAAAGVPSPQADAELLAGYVLGGVGRGGLALAPPFTPDRAAWYRELVARRAERVPLQHLTGEAPFGELSLAVGPGVFVPRPETELLAQWAVAATPPAGVVADLGAGSGALALAVARSRPGATVYAVERPGPALAWLRRNAAARAAAGERPVTVVAGDAADPELLAELAGTVDVVVTNPPYLPEGTPVPPEVGFDPPGAVFAGPDGLGVIRALLPAATRLLRSGGRLGVEHHETHREPVAALLAPWYGEVVTHPDLTRRDRFTTATRLAEPRPPLPI